MPKMGINMPDMGIKSSLRVSEAAAAYARANLSDALFTQTQQRVLGCLFGQPGRRFGVSELIQTTGAGSGAVQRELARLAGSGLVTVERRGNQKLYRANPDSPIHDELAAIVRKTFGLATPLRDALAPLGAALPGCGGLAQDRAGPHRVCLLQSGRGSDPTHCPGHEGGGRHTAIFAIA